MEIPDVSGEVTVQIPAWNAVYEIRDFSAHIQRVEALAGSNEAPIEKLDKQTWHITGTGVVTIRYAAYWDESGPFSAQLNGEHAFINPAMILMYVPDRRAEAVHLAVRDIPDSWQVTGAASRSSSESVGTEKAAGFDAESYDALVDAPVEAGKFSEFQLAGMSLDIRVVVHGDHWNKSEMEDQLRRICSYELKLMEDVPFKRYTFFVHIGKSGAGEGGGMEHANSTAISVRSEQSFPDFAAHEFFHLWNVKRIRPASLEPIDYTKEQYTRSLWFAEGVTSTYSSYALVRSGVWSKEQFYQDLSEQVSELEMRPANQWQSAEESSLDAWLEKYALYNRPQFSVSYYTKGQILGVLLDILIRDRTDNERSLDDVLRGMNMEFAKQGRTYRDSLDVRLMAEKVAGGSFEVFFRKYVAGAQELPYGQILPLAGLELRSTEKKRATLGFFAERDSNGMLVVQSVEPMAADAGLRAGDAIVSWNGSEPPRNPEGWAYSQKPGSVLRLKVRRDEKELSLDLRLGERSETLYFITPDAHPSDKGRRIREGLLQGVTQPVRVSIH
jgi:predicted metalloprotease with PDZ domain